MLVISPIQAQDTNDTSVLEDSQINTYTDLNDKINVTSDEVINLNENYRYDSDLDGNLSDGVVISNNITVVGHNNASIDGAGIARAITIESNCSVVFENLTFINGFSNSSGGAIFLKDNSSLVLRNCVFINNSVYNSNGGAIYAHMDTGLELHRCTFTDNTAIRESDLEWEKFKKGMGSAICQSIGSTLKIYDSIVKNNIAYLSTILLVSFTENRYDLSNLLIRNSLFENNTSFSSGVVYLDELGKGEIIDSTFRCNNITNHSGVVVLDASIYALLQNCLFERNHATNGGAMHIKLYEEAPANVTIVNCNFTGNVASQQGGVIYSNRGIVKIINSIFEDNACSGNGGAIIATKGSMDIENSSFINNSADKGGALYLTCECISVNNVSFIDNSADTYGGAVYSKIENVVSSDCVYVNNSASSGNDVYGAFDVEVNVLSSYFNNVSLEISVVSLWNVSPEQKIKIKFTGDKSYTTSWLDVDSQGKLNLTLPFNLNADTYSLTVSSDSGVCIPNPSKITVDKLPCKISVKKLTTTYKSGKTLKVYLKDSKTNKYLKGIKIKLKVYTGKKYKIYTYATDKNGLIKFSSSKLAVGNHKIIVYSTDDNIKLSKVTTSLNVKKATAKMTYPKSVKKTSKIKITIKNKASGKAIAKNKFKVKVFTGKKSKTYNLKTDSKGIIKVPTKKLKNGGHKITVELKNKNYNIYKKFTVKIKK